MAAVIKSLRAYEKISFKYIIIIRSNSGTNDKPFKSLDSIPNNTYVTYVFQQSLEITEHEMVVFSGGQIPISRPSYPLPLATPLHAVLLSIRVYTR